jgi:AcrR family transcriptional regulator
MHRAERVAAPYTLNKAKESTMKTDVSARERLLEAADELFYSEGVHVVGIDRVIERAGVAKASLYNTFGSKDELVVAYLERRRERIAARLTAAVAEHGDPKEQLLAIFDAQARNFERPGFRGCAFAAANAESPAGGVVDEATISFRTWLRDLFVRLAAAAGARDPESLGRQLHLLYDGATLSARMDHDPATAPDCHAAAAALIDSALPR